MELRKQSDFEDLLKATWETEDAEERTRNAVQISADVANLYSEIARQVGEISALNEKIDDLRKVNSELYSRVTKPEETPEDEPSEDDLDEEIEREVIEHYGR